MLYTQTQGALSLECTICTIDYPRSLLGLPGRSSKMSRHIRMVPSFQSQKPQGQA